METAIVEATPNMGLKGRLCLVDRRLLKIHREDLVTNHVGIVVCLRTIATVLVALFHLR